MVQGKQHSARNGLRKSLKNALTTQLNGETAEVVKAMAGEEGLKLAKMLINQRNLSEFKMAKKARLDIQKVRNALYKLHSSNLADYTMVKDSKSGVYVSYWTFNKAMAKNLFSRISQERLQRFRERLNEESSNANCFFICPASCTRADFTAAVQHSFRCLECGQLLAQEDNTKTINYLREKIREMEAVA